MSGAIKTVKKYVVEPVRNILDPGRAMRKAQEALPPPTEVIDQDEPVETATVAAETATEEAKRRSKKKKETTQTVLTSPLGSTETAATAVKKLGGGFGL